jgi:hypothetical protein
VNRLGVIARWTIWACPDCGRDRGPIAQYVYRACECGSHLPQREVEVVPATTTRGAVEALREIKRVAAVEAPPVSDEVPAKVWKIAFDALNALGGQS